MLRGFRTAGLAVVAGVWIAAQFFAGPVRADEIEIKLAHHYPKTHIQGKGYEAWAKWINERGAGKVHVTTYPAASLINGRESLGAVSKGSVQASNMLGLFQVGTMPFFNAISLPFLFEDHAHFRRALKAGLFDFIDKQYEKHNVKMMNYFTKGSTFIFHKSKFLIKPADYRNVNLRALGGYVTLMLNEFGAKAVTLPTGEVTTALQRGVVDGLTTSCTAHIARGWFEEAKYVSDVDLAESGEGLGINLQFYNGLPADVRRIVDQASKDMEDLEWDLTVKADAETCPKMWKERNLPNRKATPAERAALREAAKALYTKAEKDVPHLHEILAFVEKTRHTD
jgi:TRAP-type C4-dicarboxylate transport system substrate-binding protein